MFKAPDLQSKFTFQLAEGLPMAIMERWGSGLWLPVCPLCGMLHSLPQRIQPGTAFEPRCLAKQTHPWIVKAWQQRHPKSQGFDRVMLLDNLPVAEANSCSYDGIKGLVSEVMA